MPIGIALFLPFKSRQITRPRQQVLTAGAVIR